MIESGTNAELAQSNIALSDENASEWIKKDKRRMLHVVYRVGNLDKTIKYVYFLTEKKNLKLQYYVSYSQLVIRDVLVIQVLY